MNYYKAILLIFVGLFYVSLGAQNSRKTNNYSLRYAIGSSKFTWKGSNANLINPKEHGWLSHKFDITFSSAKKTAFSWGFGLNVLSSKNVRPGTFGGAKDLEITLTEYNLSSFGGVTKNIKLSSNWSISPAIHSGLFIYLFSYEKESYFFVDNNEDRTDREIRRYEYHSFGTIPLITNVNFVREFNKGKVINIGFGSEVELISVGSKSNYDYRWRSINVHIGVVKKM